MTAQHIGKLLSLSSLVCYSCLDSLQCIKIFVLPKKLRTKLGRRILTEQTRGKMRAFSKTSVGEQF